MRLGIRMRRRLGALVWGLGVLGAAGWSLQQRQAGQVFPGIGRETVVLVAADTDGRVNALEVGLHDEVRAGEVLVRLQDDQLVIEREVVAAELLAIAQSPDGAPEAMVDRTRDAARLRQIDLELEAVEARIRSLRTLLASGAASDGELQEAIARRDELRRRRVRVAEPEAVASTWDVVAALRRLDSVEARLQGLELRASIDGRVAAVHRRPGEVVRRGEPVLTVEESDADEVLAWVAPQSVPEPGAPVQVARADGSRLGGTIVSVSAGPDVLPESIWTIPGRPQYGVAVRVRLEGASVRPREPVRVFL